MRARRETRMGVEQELQLVELELRTTKIWWVERSERETWTPQKSDIGVNYNYHHHWDPELRRTKFCFEQTWTSVMMKMRESEQEDEEWKEHFQTRLFSRQITPRPRMMMISNNSSSSSSLFYTSPYWESWCFCWTTNPLVIDHVWMMPISPKQISESLICVLPFPLKTSSFFPESPITQKNKKVSSPLLLPHTHFWYRESK